jgi:nucleotide-binding universal stress UspA family protein
VKSEQHSRELLGAAFAEAAARGAKLRVVHAWALPDPYADRIEQRTHPAGRPSVGTERIELLLAEWRANYAGMNVEIDIVHDLPARVLVRAADHSDLLVLLRRASRTLPGHHLGATARTVLGAASSPVLVLPPHPFGPTVLGQERSGSSPE